MATFDDANEILTELKSTISQTLGNSMYQDIFRSCLERSIEQNVYGEYTPMMYERRGTSGGLADPENIDITYNSAEMELLIEDVATGNPNYEPYDTGRIDDYIESGTYYYYPAEGGLGARPFYEQAETQMEKALEELLGLIINSKF